MDEETHHDPTTSVISVQVSENSSENASQTVILVLDSEENAGFKGVETDDPGIEKDESGLKPIEETAKVIENEERTVQDDLRSSIGLNDSVSQVVLDSCIVINPHEASSCVNRDNKTASETPKSDETIADSHVISIKSDDSREGFEEKLDRETVVCRICHMSFDQSPEPSYRTRGGIMNMDMVQIGCACKDELGTAHVYCAEAWFKLKGNSLCEICGQTAKNITCLRDVTCFRDDSTVDSWDDDRLFYYSEGPSRRRRRFWNGQPFCNFLIACLVIAFVLPWFFHLDIL